MKELLDRFVKHVALSIVVVSAVIMGYIIYDLSLSKNSVAETIVEKVSDRVHAELTNYFEPIQHELRTTATQTRVEGFYNMDSSDFTQLFIPVITSFPHITSMGIADEDGIEFDIIKDTLPEQWLTRQINLDHWGEKERWYSFTLDERYNKTKDSSWFTDLFEDPRSRIWFKGAVEQDRGKLFWTNPYQRNESGELNITVSTSWFNDLETQKRIILSYDIRLQDISNFTNALKPTENGEVMILSGDKQQVIGAPQGYKKEAKEANIINKELSKVVNLPESSRPIRYKSEGIVWWGATKEFKLNDEQSFLIVIALPENDFLKEINESQFLMAGGFLGILILSILILRSHNKQRRQKLALEEKNKEINKQKEVISKKNEEIVDSINYARRIQAAILPPIRLVNNYLNNSFVLYIPKDIVAGDFYWMESIKSKQNENLTLFAAADCTGHGVPGAMVSVMCHNALNRSVREFGFRKANKILDKSRELVVEEFSKSDFAMSDGMDISLCVLNMDTLELSWAGANNPLWIVRANDIIEYKPDKQPVGNHLVNDPFTNHDIQLQKGDVIYVFSDGIQDQFGGPKGKKFKIKRLKDLLLEVHQKKPAEQHDIIVQTIEEWKGEEEQVDDICLIGVQL